MPEYFKAPQLSARFQQEEDDFNKVNEMPAKALDPRLRSLQRQAHPNNTYMRDYAEGMQVQHERNKMGAKANAFKQNLSDRDLQWQNMQQDRDRNFQLQEREMANRESETKYRQGRDAVADTRAEKAEQIRYATALANDRDEVTSAQGQAMLDQLMNGGGQSSQSSGPNQVGPMGNGQTPSYQDQRVTMAMDERKARLQREKQEAEDKRNRDAYSFEETKANNAENRFNKQRNTKLDFFKAALGETSDPTERARLLNEGAATSSALAPLASRPKGMLGIGNAVGDALEGGYNQADQAGQTAARNMFKVDPLKQKQYDASQKRGERAIGNEDVALLDQDADFGLARTLILAKVKEVANVGMLNKNASPEAIKGIMREIDNVVETTAMRTETNPERVRGKILQDITKNLEGYPDGVSKQLLAAISRQDVGGQERSFLGKTADTAADALINPFYAGAKAAGLF